MKVGEASEEHVERIVELWDQLARAHEERDGSFRRAPDAQAFFRSCLREYMASPDALVLVCEGGGRTAGYLTALVRLNPPILEGGPYGLVEHLVVDPADRGRGAGKSLALAALDWFASGGIGRVEVEVAEWNREGTAFWRAMGFGPFQSTLARELPRHA